MRHLKKSNLLVIFIVFFAALLLSVPIGIALGISALAGLIYLSFDPDFFIFLPQKFMSGLDSFTLLAIPFFILAGAIMSYGGIARRIVDLTLVFFGRMRLTASAASIAAAVAVVTCSGC